MMYLIYGESFRLMEEEIKKITKEETNICTMDLEINSIEDILNEANYVSLFQDKKTIIVKNALFFTTAKSDMKEVDLLLKYMENPNPLTTIIFTTYDKIDARKKITKDFTKKFHVVAIGNLSYEDMMIKVRDLLFKQKLKINNETLNYIINACKNNYDCIYNECMKLFLFYETPCEVKLEDVKNIVSRNIEDNNFKFVEAVVSKDFASSQIILEDLFTQKVDPIALLLLLAREYRLMLSVNILLSNGYKTMDICKKLGLQDWQLKKLEKNMGNFYEEDLKSILKRLSTIDYKLKSGKGDKYTEMKTFLLSLF